MSLFWILAVVSTIGYALNSLFMAPLVRGHDSLSIGMYRNLSLGLSFLPLTLWLVPMESWADLALFWKELLLASFVTVGAVWASHEAVKRTPLGIFSVAHQGIRVILITIWGFLFWNEILSGAQLFGMAVLLGGMVWMKMQKVDFEHLLDSSWQGRLGYILISVVCLSAAVILLIDVSRQMHPILAGHVWEFGIGVCSLVVLLIRQKLGYQKLERISLKRFGKVLLAASPTLLGTGGYAMAATMGPAGILSAVGVVGLVFLSLVGAFFLKERLTSHQWIGITISIIGLLILRLVS